MSFLIIKYLIWCFTEKLWLFWWYSNLDRSSDNKLILTSILWFYASVYKWAVTKRNGLTVKLSSQYDFIVLNIAWDCAKVKFLLSKNFRNARIAPNRFFLFTFFSHTEIKNPILSRRQLIPSDFLIWRFIMQALHTTRVVA